MSRKDPDFVESAKLNRNTFDMYRTRLFELALNMYEWRGLPDTVDPRFLEWCLVNDGMAVFFRDEVMGLLALQVMINGPLDVYRIPINRRAYAVNGYQKILNPGDSVIIFNNYTHTNSILDLEMYARRMYEIERAIDVNVKGQKTPKMIRCPENQRLTMVNLYQKYDGNQPFIFANKDLDINSLMVLDTTAPFVADKLEMLKRQIWGEAMTYLGIENSNSDKKERLITDEVESNLGSVEAQRFTKLNARRDAAKKINAMFGTDITVKFREEKQPEASADPAPDDGGDPIE